MIGVQGNAICNGWLCHHLADLVVGSAMKPAFVPWIWVVFVFSNESFLC